MRRWYLALNNVAQKIDEVIIDLSKKVERSFRLFSETTDYVESHITGMHNVSISDIRKDIIDKWVEYGWVPVLPTFHGRDIIKNIIPPATDVEADTMMMKTLDRDVQEQLFHELELYVKSNNHNEETLSEAIETYKKGLNTACSILLFALIDSCFVTMQPIIKGKDRTLAGTTAKTKIKRTNNLMLSCADITLDITKNLFSYGNDFNPNKEKGLNRNYISHGMNRYTPDSKDCLKLFVLLYNIYLLFDSEIFECK